jgi:hypothetical protein
MANYSNDILIAQVKRKAMMPANQNTFTPEEILNIATDEILNEILPAITSAREEYFTQIHDEVLDGSNTIDTPFPIPSRAVGMALREVSLLQGDTEYNMVRKDLEDKQWLNGNSNTHSFRIQNNNVHLFGPQTGTLLMYYYLRPSQLVTLSSVATLTEIAPTGSAANTIAVSTLKNNWVAGEKLDIINHKNGFEVKAISMVIQSVATLDPSLNPVKWITFTEALPDDVVVGNWVANEDESPVPNIPQEWFQYLAQATVVHILEALGDFEAMKLAASKLAMMKINAMKLITPRVDGQSKKFVPRRNRGAHFNSQWRS